MTILLDTNNNMLCYEVTADDIAEAEKEFHARFEKSNMMNHRTVYDRKDSRLAGILGEIVFKKIYPDAQKSLKDITYDFSLGELKIDVKCKFRKVAPSPEFQSSFFMYQMSDKFKANTYYFMSTTPSFKYVWLCGYISKRDFLNHPNKEVWKAGQADPSNGMSFREDTLCLKYKYLKALSLSEATKGKLM